MFSIAVHFLLVASPSFSSSISRNRDLCAQQHTWGKAGLEANARAPFDVKECCRRLPTELTRHWLKSSRCCSSPERRPAYAMLLTMIDIEVTDNLWMQQRSQRRFNMQNKCMDAPWMTQCMEMPTFPFSWPAVTPLEEKPAGCATSYPATSVQQRTTGQHYLRASSMELMGRHLS